MAMTTAASSTPRAAHIETVAEAAALAQTVLGQPITALAIGIATPKQIGKWAQDEGAPNDVKVEQRLLVLARIITLLQTRYADHHKNIRTWVISPQPLLNEYAVIDVLQSDDKDDWASASQAARAFVE
ncbi:MAG: hypothetical protein H7287_01310 [Thermoleophilia bacterium]|nr:hypothetical protein [Thermoleophilia bacterium]